MITEIRLASNDAAHTAAFWSAILATPAAEIEPGVWLVSRRPGEPSVRVTQARVVEAITRADLTVTVDAGAADRLRELGGGPETNCFEVAVDGSSAVDVNGCDNTVYICVIEPGLDPARVHLGRYEAGSVWIHYVPGRGPITLDGMTSARIWVTASTTAPEIDRQIDQLLGPEPEPVRAWARRAVRGHCDRLRDSAEASDASGIDAGPVAELLGQWREQRDAAEDGPQRAFWRNTVTLAERISAEVERVRGQVTGLIPKRERGAITATVVEAAMRQLNQSVDAAVARAREAAHEQRLLDAETDWGKEAGIDPHADGEHPYLQQLRERIAAGEGPAELVRLRAQLHALGRVLVSTERLQAEWLALPAGGDSWQLRDLISSAVDQLRDQLDQRLRYGAGSMAPSTHVAVWDRVARHTEVHTVAAWEEAGLALLAGVVAQLRETGGRVRVSSSVGMAVGHIVGHTGEHQPVECSWYPCREGGALVVTE